MVHTVAEHRPSFLLFNAAAWQPSQAASCVPYGIRAWRMRSEPYRSVCPSPAAPNRQARGADIGASRGAWIRSPANRRSAATPLHRIRPFHSFLLLGMVWMSQPVTKGDFDMANVAEKSEGDTVDRRRDGLCARRCGQRHGVRHCNSGLNLVGRSSG